MRHTEAIRYEGHLGEKSLFNRAMGKFYTPDFVVERLCSQLLGRIEFSGLDTFSLNDPFCGDGRLIVALLRQAVEGSACRNIHWHISLWDYDAEALAVAEESVRQIVASFGIDAELHLGHCDSFLVSRDEYGQYDCVITNPPWETLKPDSREMLEMSPEKKSFYRDALKEYDRQLAKVLPNSQPLKKYGGWGTNLSRSGVELALRLTKRDGKCGIVTPMTLFNDHISSPLRKWIFAEAQPFTLDYYPAEARLFSGVDQETVSISFEKHPTKSFQLAVTTFDRNRDIASSTNLEVTHDLLTSLDYCLPVKHGEFAMQLLDKWHGLQRLEDLEVLGVKGIWIGRELDETGYKNYLVDSGEHRFLKGRMIGRFGFIEQPTQFVSDELVRVPDTVSYFRIVWRDVSRRSQARRMYAAIIPPGIVTGNSLNVLHIHKKDLLKLQVLVSVMNSVSFEFQVRSRLGTGHISASIVKKISIPDLNNNPYLNRVPEFFDGLGLKDAAMERDLEIIVAKAYKLNRDEYHMLLDNSEGLTDEYKSSLLAKWYDFD